MSDYLKVENTRQGHGVVDQEHFCVISVRTGIGKKLQWKAHLSYRLNFLVGAVSGCDEIEKGAFHSTLLFNLHSWEWTLLLFSKHHVVQSWVTAAKDYFNRCREILHGVVSFCQAVAQFISLAKHRETTALLAGISHFERKTFHFYPLHVYSTTTIFTCMWCMTFAICGMFEFHLVIQWRKWEKILSLSVWLVPKRSQWYDRAELAHGNAGVCMVHQHCSIDLGVDLLTLQVGEISSNSPQHTCVHQSLVVCQVHKPQLGHRLVANCLSLWAAYWFFNQSPTPNNPSWVEVNLFCWIPGCKKLARE